ncbi:MAG: carbohydrate binding family 9 domain-containing protein [bacterium]|nr:carbohydrate binding family 9 domain-containing protein [bacterium]
MTRWIILVFLFSATCANAEFTPVYSPQLDIKPTSGKITIDGVVEEGEWSSAAVASNFAEHNPGDQIQPPVDTKAMITYDADNLYISFICYDDPASIRASFCKRDRIFQDDNVLVCLDTYGDGATAFEIGANPYGIQGDLFFSAGNGEDMSYDLIYQTAGRITDQGWEVEFAIPFSSLRFPDQPEQIWKVDFWRNRSRDVRYQMSWAAYDRDESCWPCQWGTMRGLNNLTPAKGLELLPAIVSHQAGSRNEAGDFDNGSVVTRGSFTAKYGLSSNITLEGTIRPDFSQVESDAAQIDVNSRYALFYPEKRPFFMEGSDLFSTWFNAVYTRSINDPTVAGKITGRSGQTSFAVLSALDRNTAIIIPLEDNSRFVQNGESLSNIFRAKYEIGDQSSIGVVGTDRRYDEGGSGSLFGVDSRIRIDRNHQLEFQYLHSFTTEPEDSLLTADFHNETFDNGKYTQGFDGESFSGHGLYASFERDSRNWSFDFDYWDRSPTFRAENGFETFNSQRSGSFRTQYNFRFDDSPVLENILPSFFAQRSWNYDGLRKDDLIRIDFDSSFRWAQTGFHPRYEKSSEVFQGKRFNNLWSHHVCFRTTPSERIHFGGYLNYSNRIYYEGMVVGRQTDSGVWVDLRPWDRLLVETRFNNSRNRSLEGDETYFDGFITRTKISLQISRELSTRLVLQYNRFSETWEADPLLTYQLNPFSIFYIGSSRDYQLFSPNNNPEVSWQLSARQYFVKFQYLFRI